MSTILRISKIAQKQGLSIGALEREIGASKGVLSRALKNNTDIQSKWTTLLIEKYPNYNANWLLTGVGDMTLTLKDIDQVKEPQASYDSKNNAVSDNYPLEDQKIPLISIDSNESLILPLKKRNIIDYYVIPKFKNKKTDFLIEVTGDSMSPKYNSGDIVSCTILKNPNFIQWNKPHLIITKEQGLLIKRLKQSKQKGYLSAISDNPSYDTFDFSLKEVIAIALINGGIFSE